MGSVIEWIRGEPVIVSRIVPLALAGAAAFGYVVTEDQRSWLLMVVALVIDIANSVKARSKVTPMEKVREVSPSVAQALE